MRVVHNLCYDRTADTVGVAREWVVILRMTWSDEVGRQIRIWVARHYFLYHRACFSF